jgi:hypothetical protein
LFGIRLGGRTLVVCALVGAAGVAALAFVYWVDPAAARLYPRCMFHATTGLDCPFCGSSRAAHALVHGQVIEALRFNPLFVLAGPIAALLLAYPRIRQAVNPAARPRQLFTFWICMGIALAFGVVRNIPVPLFDRMASGVNGQQMQAQVQTIATGEPTCTR